MAFIQDTNFPHPIHTGLQFSLEKKNKKSSLSLINKHSFLLTFHL